jgi:uncharacterized membrane protein
MATTSTTPPARGLVIALWIAQVLLSLAFLAAGFFKITSASTYVEMLPMPVPLVLFIGVVEVLGAVGLIVPAVTRIAPRLVPLAALGLFVIMVLAFGTHAMRAEWSGLPSTVFLGALAAFVAWGRWKKAPIEPRSV